jgi:hypothetical protein
MDVAIDVRWSESGTAALEDSDDPGSDLEDDRERGNGSRSSPRSRVATTVADLPLGRTTVWIGAEAS